MSPSTLTLPDMNACITAAWSSDERGPGGGVVHRQGHVRGRQQAQLERGLPAAGVEVGLDGAAAGRVADDAGSRPRRAERREAVPVLVADGLGGVDPLLAEELVSHRSAPRIGYPIGAAGAAVAPTSGAAHRSGPPTIVDHVSAAAAPPPPRPSPVAVGRSVRGRIGRDEVAHVARLALLELTDDELEHVHRAAGRRAGARRRRRRARPGRRAAHVAPVAVAQRVPARRARRPRSTATRSSPRPRPPRAGASGCRPILGEEP